MSSAVTQVLGYRRGAKRKGTFFGESKIEKQVRDRNWCCGRSKETEMRNGEGQTSRENAHEARQPICGGIDILKDKSSRPLL